MDQIFKTRLTEKFGIRHPIILAPMAHVSGGKLAAAVSRAGGLGLIGGGYGDEVQISGAFADARGENVGLGIINWRANDRSELIDHIFSFKLAALLVSFGDGQTLFDRAVECGVPTLWQVPNLLEAKQAFAAGVDVIVVQGQEAGGHGHDRGLFSLLPAVRDLTGPDQIIVAAGGIADGRGLAAALMLGADGILMGTRFFASTEANASQKSKDLLLEKNGDQTIRSSIFDIARGLAWPEPYTGRCVRNAFSDQWESDLAGLRNHASREQNRYDATDPEDYETRALIAGEALDLIKTIQPAVKIIDDTVRQAAVLLGNSHSLMS